MLTRAKCGAHYQDEIAAFKGPFGKVWCVPSAISYLTGKDYEDAEAHLRPFLVRKRKRERITWVYRSEWEACLEATLPPVRLFYCRTKDRGARNKTLSRFYSEIRKGVFFVQTSRHVLLLVDGEVYDNQRAGQLPYGLKGYWKCRVRSIWIVR
jgi:hypothetical protein